jgi:hypothetical protein
MKQHYESIIAEEKTAQENANREMEYLTISMQKLKD